VRKDDIAIIGIGCRFPGGADGPTRFWEMLLAGVDAIAEVPRERWDVNAFYDSRAGMPGKTVARRGGFIEGIDLFDAEFFGISPREAELMDPQQRLLVEAAWEAIEDGGVLLDREAAGTGVFVGISTNDYSLLQSSIDELGTIDVYTTTGSVMSIAANRVSYALNLGGPSLAVDTACSSSLIAIHLACRALRDGDCRLALAGGVNALLLPTPFVAFSRMSMLAADGRCKAFDARADGFVRAEGVGVIALQPLADALAEGRLIYAVIRGTAANQDGHTNGLTVPSASAQEAVIRTACRDAGVDESAIAYVEAHGTGTPVGDPIEAHALGKAIGEARPPDSPLLIGSVKTNIGHLEAGAGVAGVIKTALTLCHGQVPSSLNFEQPTPHVPFDALNLEVVARPTPLAIPAVAGVNSFGFGGSNAHAILASPPERPARQPARDPGAVLLTLSARSRDRRAAVAEAWQAFLAAGGDGASADLADLCHSAATRRNHLDERMAVAAESREELVARLAMIAAGQAAPGASMGRAQKEPAPPVFVYSGQGTQWWAMGRQLLASDPTFRAVIERCDSLFADLGDWSLIEELGRDEATSRLNRTDIAQPAIFAVQAALTALWRSWGIEPAATVGHSVGEVAAAWAAGILTLEDAARVIFHRGRTMEAARERGRMLAAAITAATAEEMIAPYGGRVSLGAVNSPSLMTLSGDGEPLAAIAAVLGERGIFNRFLAVEYAFHSAHMDAVRDNLIEALAIVPLHKPTVPVVSTVTATWADGDDYGSEYWWRNVREPVLFGPAIERLAERGFATFLEIGAHPALAGPIADCLRSAGKQGSVLASLKRGEPERPALLTSLGALHVAGHEVKWDAVLGDGRAAVRLPPQVWQRQRYWHESERSRVARLATAPHPLLGRALQTSEPTWEADLDLRLLPWLADHRVQDHTLFPAAGFIEMMSAAGAAVFADGATLIEDVDFRKALVLAEEEPAKVQLSYRVASGAVEVMSRAKTGEWSLNAAGSIRRREPGPEPTPMDIAGLRARLTGETSGAALAESFGENGLHYGPAFRGTTVAFFGPGEALARIEVPESIAGATDRYRVHPALLDACLQAIIAALPDDGLASGPFLPVSITRMELRHPVTGPVWSYVRTRLAAGRTIVADLTILDDDGRALIEIGGFRCQALVRQRSSTSTSIDEWLHAEVWRPRPRPGAVSSADKLAPPARIAAAATRVAERDGAPDGRLGRHAGRIAAADAVATAWMVAALRQLGWSFRKGSRTTVEALVTRLGVAASHRRLFDRVLHFLGHDGVIERHGEAITVLRRPASRDPEAMWRRLMHEEPGYLPELTLIRRCGSRLASLLRGDLDPLAVLFPNGSPAVLEHFYQSSWSMLTYDVMVAEAVAEAISTVPAARPLRVLEIGAGTGGLTSHVLPRLPAERTQYFYTDVSNAFFTRAEQAFFDYRFVEFATLDIERPPEEQGFAPGSFDIVLASDVLHATRDLRETALHVRSLLAPGGLFVGIEIPWAVRWSDMVFGLMEGWWRFADGERTDHPAITGDAWVQLLAGCGFIDPRTLTVPHFASGDQQLVLVARCPAGPSAEARPAAPVAPEPVFEKPWLLLADLGGLGGAVEHALTARGDRVIVVQPGDGYRRVNEMAFAIRPDCREDFTRLVEDLNSAGLSPAVAVHLWGLDAPAAEATTPAALADAETAGCIGLMHLVQALEAAGWSTTRLVVATRGSQAIADAPVTVAAAPTWGLGRVAAREERSLDCLLVDLDPAMPQGEVDELIAEIAVDDGEREVAFRDGGRYVNRAVRTTFEQLAPVPTDRADVGYRLEIPSPGVLDRLALVARRRSPPGPGEVEIAVRAASLNFRDVMKAIGIYPSESTNDDLPGDECSGVITAVGPGVDHLAVGDAVVAIGSGCLASHVTLPAGLVFRKPERLDFEEAVTIPVPFLTAWYALHEIGRLRRGETVLLHAATGGVGLAALQVAHAADARVMATAGSHEKRELLGGLGVEHVMDSRSLAFADEVLSATGGRGVDVVLNSLSGRAIEKGLSVLAPGGRFLELGKSDIYLNTRVGLRPFRNNVSLQAIDLRQVMDNRPELAAAALGQVLRRIENGRFSALPHRVFPMGRVVDAFRLLAQARHIGKVVVTTGGSPVTALPLAERRQPDLRAEATYVVTGGLGGFGLAVADWLVERGARHVVLIGRRGAASEEAQAAVAALQARGVEVVVAAADVTSREDIDRVFAGIARDMPPVRGIVHAAMVLDDGLVAQLDGDRIRRVTAPKVLGGWHLHQLSLSLDLDFFVMFSSMASLLGNAGQANYVAANHFLVALAHHRRRLGLPALAVDWGRIADVGYVERNAEVAQHLERIGLLGMPVARAVEALGRAMMSGASHVGVLRADWQALAKTADGRVPPRLRELAEGSAGLAERGEQGLRETLLAAPAGERLDLLVTMLRDQVGSVLRAAPSDLDVDRPLTDLGLDSLMAIDLVNRIESAFEIAVPRDRLSAGATIAGLAVTLLELIVGVGATPAAPATAPAETGAPRQCLVPLRSGGGRPPLFLIHPTGGAVAGYAALVAALPASLPVVAVQSRALVTKMEEFAAFGAMAEAYADLIARQRPQGPLHLGGFSLGGFVALAAAAVLERSGRDVAMVALIDSDPAWAQASRSRSERVRRGIEEMAGGLGRDLGLFAGVDDAELAGPIAALAEELLEKKSEAERVGLITTWLAKHGLDHGAAAEQMRRAVPIMIRHIALFDAYEPSVVRAPIVSWRTRGGLDATASWSDFAGGGIDEELFDCGHYEILVPPIVSRLANALDAALLDADRVALAGEAAE